MLEAFILLLDVECLSKRYTVIRRKQENHFSYNNFKFARNNYCEIY